LNKIKHVHTWPLALLFFAHLGYAAPTQQSFEQHWSALVDTLDAQKETRISLQASDFAELAKGKVARRRVHLDGPDRVIGAIWSTQAPDALWLSILDDKHFKLVDGLFEDYAAGSRPDRKLLYQHLSLPWPFKARQWVIAISNHQELFKATQGRVWVRTWDLIDPSAAPKPDPAAIWIDTSEGGWIMTPIEQGTLLVYHARASMGGVVPDDAAAMWVKSTLDNMLRDIATRAATMPSHYIDGHESVERPDRSPIPTW